MTSTWTPYAVNYLEALVDSGMSAREIGDCLGVTRNAVIGKCNREGFRLRGAVFGPNKNLAGIVRDLKGDVLLQREIAVKHGVCVSTVTHINTGRVSPKITGASFEKPLRPYKRRDVLARQALLGEAP